MAAFQNVNIIMAKLVTCNIELPFLALLFLFILFVFIIIMATFVGSESNLFEYSVLLFTQTDRKLSCFENVIWVVFAVSGKLLPVTVKIFS